MNERGRFQVATNYLSCCINVPQVWHPTMLRRGHMFNLWSDGAVETYLSLTVDSALSNSIDRDLSGVRRWAFKHVKRLSILSRNG